MSKPKILHILRMGAFSGAEKVTISIIKHTCKKYDHIYVCAKGPIENILKEKGIKYRAFDTINRKSVKEIICIEKPNLIHAHDFYDSIIASISGAKCPIVSHLHNNSPWLKRLGIKSLVYLLSTFKYKKILTVSEAVLGDFIFGEWVKNKSLVISNPIDIKEIQKDAKEAELIDGFDVVNVGRLSDQKNPYIFIEIVYGVKKYFPNVKAAMIGTGELFDGVKNRINELNLDNNIKLFGFINNPYGILQNSKMMCLPSKWEGFGLVAIEALSLGVPVICSGAGGLINIVNNNCGKICRETNDYIVEIVKMLNDKGYRNNKSVEALIRATELDNIDRYFVYIEEIYDSLI